MLSLLAGDRAGLRYGTKRIVVFGGAWWNFWMLIISLLVNGRDDVSLYLKLASMGGMLALANLPQLLSSVRMTPTVAKTLVAISSSYALQKHLITMPLTRARGMLACVYCRRRKRRCDGVTPTCGTCARKGLICNYTKPDSSSVPRHQTLARIASLLESHPDILSRSPEPHHGDHVVERPTMSGLVSPRPHLNPTLNNASMPSATWLFNSPFSVDDDANLPPLTIPLGYQTSTSSLLMQPLVQALVGVYPEDFFFRVESKRQVVPSMALACVHDDDCVETPRLDSDTTRTLVDRFFETDHSINPFLDKKAFLARYNEVFNRHPSMNDESAVVLAVLAIGAIDGKARKSNEDSLEDAPEEITRLSWSCFLIEWYATYLRRMYNLQRLTAFSDIVSEFHQPRSGIEPLVDKVPYPRSGDSPSPASLAFMAEISVRFLINRVQHSIYFTDGVTIYSGRLLDSFSSNLSNQNMSDESLLSVCKELDHQLETWYQSLPEIIKPALSSDLDCNPQAKVLRLRYCSSTNIGAYLNNAIGMDVAAFMGVYFAAHGLGLGHGSQCRGAKPSVVFPITKSEPAPVYRETVITGPGLEAPTMTGWAILV
ncbi:hypothetical protein CNMCM5623_003533 [Aspergillus felis]|uniref:Zn(2)-C6 fungal-type domain-containing protein n=1 Tax=Aspergillus felis TaxID=1287682 RepID=A0A8H6QFJ8_9EURO|nr:hypothetical protein CNMCM5623_003533 [Aspergillus felis]